MSAKLRVKTSWSIQTAMDTYKQGRIWYAQVVAGDRMLPVRMEFDTPFGRVKGYLAELRGRGVTLQLLK